MKEYFSKSVTGGEKLPQIFPNPAMRYRKKKGENPTSDILTLGENSYLLFNEFPHVEKNEVSNKIISYLSTERKTKKSRKISRYAIAVLADENCYELQKKTDEKIIGYLKTIVPKHYVAVTKPRGMLLLLWLLPILLLLLMLIPQNPTPIFTPDEVIDGAITPIEIAGLEPDYFNIKINATPILEGGKMNIRIENSLRNIFSCKVEISLENGDIIYTSPMLAPNQSLEYATIDADIPVGSYDGMAVFRYFDGEDELEVQSSVKLVVGVR